MKCDGASISRRDELLRSGPSTSQRKLLDSILPIFRIGCFGNQFQVSNHLAEANVALVRKYQSRKPLLRALPVLRQYAKAYILCHHDAIQRSRQHQQFIVGKLIGCFLRRSDDVHPTEAKLQNYRSRHMRVRIESDRHQRWVCSFRRTKNGEVGWTFFHSSTSRYSAISSSSIS